jgi:cell division protein FtsW
MKFATTALVFCVSSLISLGLVMLYSAGMLKGENAAQLKSDNAVQLQVENSTKSKSESASQRKREKEHPAQYFVKQLASFGVGLMVCCIAATLNYHILRKLAWVLFGASVLLLVLVLIPGIGARHGGARRWFDLPGISFQPSELAKVMLLVLIAWYGERYQRQMKTFGRGLLLPGLFIGLTLGLIFFEPDVGTTILLAAVSASMLLIAGVKWRHFLPPVAIAVGAMALFLWHDPMRSSRIYSWLHLEETKLDKGLQAWQARVALGSGGWDGLGLGNGRQKLGSVPEHHTDFIFSVIGEELGLIATLAVVVVFGLFVYCGLFISLRAPDLFGLLLGAGITLMIGIQAFINIGVVTGTLPNKGLPLPFISYGGSNLVLALASVGILLSIARHAEKPAQENSDAFPSRDVVATQTP